MMGGVAVAVLVRALVAGGPGAIAAALANSLGPTAMPACLGLLYTCVIATAVGSGMWTWLSARYPAGQVAPFSMLVPVVGILTAAVVLAERPSVLELVGGAVVVAGVLIGAGRSQRRQADGLATEALADDSAAAKITA